MDQRIAILASGEGTTFEAIASAVKNKELSNAVVVGLICNRPKAAVIQKAQQLEVPCSVIDHKYYADRGAYEEKLLEQLKMLEPDWICLAGYMLILGKAVVNAYPNKIINIHPSLLPKYKGLNAIQQAIDAGESKTGCTVHLVNEKLDDGKTLAQSEINILPSETAAELAIRMKTLEHQTYIRAIKALGV